MSRGPAVRAWVDAAGIAGTYGDLLDGIAAHADDLARLGPHTTGVGCLYLADVAAVDAEVLRDIVSGSFARVGAGELESTNITITG